MSVVERYGNWCSIDRLDDVDLRDGERLAVRWPDGEVQRVTLSVEDGTFEVSEQGGPPYHARRSHASVIAYHRGVQVKVPIVGLEAERIVDDSCSTCGSPQPQLHPAVQSEGEVQVCRDDFHRQITVQNTASRIYKRLDPRD